MRFILNPLRAFVAAQINDPVRGTPRVTGKRLSAFLTNRVVLVITGVNVSAGVSSKPLIGSLCFQSRRSAVRS